MATQALAVTPTMVMVRVGYPVITLVAATATVPRSVMLTTLAALLHSKQPISH